MLKLASFLTAIWPGRFSNPRGNFKIADRRSSVQEAAVRPVFKMSATFEPLYSCGHDDHSERGLPASPSVIPAPVNPWAPWEGKRLASDLTPQELIFGDQIVNDKEYALANGNAARSSLLKHFLL